MLVRLASVLQALADYAIIFLGSPWSIRAAGAYFWKACADDEPGLLPAPGGWLAKIRIFFPLPVHAGLDELPCID